MTLVPAEAMQLKFCCKEPPMRASPIVLCGLLMCVIFPPSAAGDANRPATQPAGHVLTFTVLDSATGQPLPGVTLHFDGAAGHQNFSGKKSTDVHGEATMSFPSSKVEYSNVEVSKEGYVPMRASWPGRRAGDARLVPDTYMMKLERGTTIGGQVVDDAGKAIPGATVMLQIHKKLPQPNAWVNVSFESVKTAADGKWSYASAPPQFDSINIGVYHPLYASEEAGAGFYPMNEFKPISSLRNQSAKFVLPRGIKITGTVYGANDQPLPGASIGLGADRMSSNVLPEIETDAQGQFELACKPGNMVVLTVKAKGYAPDLARFPLSDKKPAPIEFHLRPPHMLRGRVIDPAGKPINCAWVVIDSWRGARTINANLHTDAEGRFTWHNAPADQVQGDILAAGYADLRDTPLLASDKEITLTMRKPLHVHGVVTDAETGKPIERFKRIPGISFGPDQPMVWERRNAVAGKDGAFEFEQSYPYPGYVVRIEAEGYQPADSRVFKIDEGDVSLEFKLEHGHSIAGIVRDAQGNPASDVKVALATPGQTIYIRNGSELVDQGCLSTTTDQQGNFSFPPQTGEYLVAAFGAQGYAQVSASELGKSSDIKLVPWGRIEGTVLVSGKPGAHSEMSLADSFAPEPNQPRIFFEEGATSDGNGHFVFDRVRSGETTVRRTVRVAMGGSGWLNGPTHETKVNVKPGQTSHVQLGVSGRPVIGRVSIPDEVKKRSDWIFGFCQIVTHFDTPKPPPLPDNYQSMDAQQKKQWYENWQKTDAGKAFQAAQEKQRHEYRSYTLLMQKDGSFRADDVPAGDYQINISITQPTPGNSCGPGDAVAEASSRFTIPPIPGGRSDKPFELPTLSMTIEKTVKVGEVAPAFSVKSLDGKPIALSDYRGKLLLLDFWATWCGPCVAETPNLKSVYDAFGSNPKFAMLSLSLDHAQKAPRQFAKTQGIKWTQGFLGEWSQAQVTKDYGVRGIPSIWLIGPDGKVLAKDLRGDAMKETVGDALKRMQ
jgi:peroxiredoxin/uncharacterized GH25 family protein/protocatechuate 3,4-dioxygenase beta subunit